MATTYVLEESRKESPNSHQLLGNGLHGRFFYALCFLSHCGAYPGDILSPPTLPEGHGFLFCLEIMSHLELPQK